MESWRVGKGGHSFNCPRRSFRGKLKSTASLKGIWYKATPQLNQLLVQSPVPYPTEARPLRVGGSTLPVHLSPCEFRQRDGREGTNPLSFLLSSELLVDDTALHNSLFSCCRAVNRRGAGRVGLYYRGYSSGCQSIWSSFAGSFQSDYHKQIGDVIVSLETTFLTVFKNEDGYDLISLKIPSILRLDPSVSLESCPLSHLLPPVARGHQQGSRVALHLHPQTHVESGGVAPTSANPRLQKHAWLGQSQSGGENCGLQRGKLSVPTKPLCAR